jgi:hypothetical protein
MPKKGKCTPGDVAAPCVTFRVQPYVEASGGGLYIRGTGRHGNESCAVLRDPMPQDGTERNLTGRDGTGPVWRDLVPRDGTERDGIGRTGRDGTGWDPAPSGSI